jgi:hypothetical protein
MSMSLKFSKKRWNLGSRSMNAADSSRRNLRSRFLASRNTESTSVYQQPIKTRVPKEYRGLKAWRTDAWGAQRTRRLSAPHGIQQCIQMTPTRRAAQFMSRSFALEIYGSPFTYRAFNSSSDVPVHSTLWTVVPHCSLMSTMF